MDTQALKAFIVVAESLSFSQASEQLHLTQSAVSKRIQLLEQQLETPLFYRHNRTISLTNAGKQLLPKAQRILALIEDSETEIANLRDTVTGDLSLATSHHIGLHRLPTTLRSYVQSYPDVRLHINFMGSEGAYQAVRNRQVELALTTLDTEASQHPDIHTEHLWQDSMVCVCGPDHQLSRVEKMSLELLAEHPAILPEPDTITFQLISNTFLQNQLTLQNPMPTNYLETIKMMVSVGIGWSLLPNTMVDDQVTVIPWPEQPIHRDLGIIYLKNRTLSNPANALVNQLQIDSCQP